MGYFNPYWVLQPKWALNVNWKQHHENGAFDNGATAGLPQLYRWFRPPVIMTDDGSALLSSSGAKSAAKSSQRTSVANLIAQLTLRVL
jgi:hypothetical protein